MTLLWWEWVALLVGAFLYTASYTLGPYRPWVSRWLRRRRTRLTRRHARKSFS